jgi:hypothetical protein
MDLPNGGLTGHTRPMSDVPVDLERLLEHERSVRFDVWLDPLSPATTLLLPYLHLDGRTHGGRPWRFRGHDDVGLRLVPAVDDPLSALVTRCILCVRAWAVSRSAGDHLVPMDYDLPWSYLGDIVRDLPTTRAMGLPHLVALAGREGDWLGDWVAEHHDDPRVFAAADRGAAAAASRGITDLPTVTIGDTRFEAATMPDDIADRIAARLDA